ncbi:MAG: sigma-70 family RNA polymerase sigma factor [Anaerolineaceae bacterium]|jgi:RNA polymerase sigma-70 factor (ECF subfamily)|nr:sigma-70 family RNA polymerase sigma factor [Anaerolineaceae bacterium]
MREIIDWQRHYNELLPKVFRFFWFKVGDRSLSEDLASATFEKAWKSRGRFREDLGGFDSWVFGIARNVVSDHFRSQKPQEDFDETRLVSPSEQIENEVEKSEEFARLQQILIILDSRERDLISYKYGAELTNRQIAHLTGLSESNVGVILFRAVEKLRSQWEVEKNER